MHSCAKLIWRLFEIRSIVNEKAFTNIYTTENKNCITYYIVIKSFIVLYIKKSFFFLNLDLRKHSIPSTTKPFSLRRIFLPCFELLWTNIFSETTEIPPSCNGSIEVDTETWNRRISLGFPAFFKQFWLHLRKNLSWYLKKKWI